MTRLFKDNINFRNGQMVIEEDGQVQEIITTSDAKQFFSTAVNEFFMQDDAAADTQWQDIFRVVPGRGHGELFPFRPPSTVDTVDAARSEEHTSELQSPVPCSYAVFCLKKKFADVFYTALKSVKTEY